MGLHLGESYSSERKYHPFSSPSSSATSTSCCIEVELPAAWDYPSHSRSCGLLEGEQVGPPPGRLHGFLFFLGPSRELRRKPALYRDADTMLLGE